MERSVQRAIHYGMKWRETGASDWNIKENNYYSSGAFLTELSNGTEYEIQVCGLYYDGDQPADEMVCSDSFIITPTDMKLPPTNLAATKADHPTDTNKYQITATWTPAEFAARHRILVRTHWKNPLNGDLSVTQEDRDNAQSPLTVDVNKPSSRPSLVLDKYTVMFLAVFCESYGGGSGCFGLGDEIDVLP